MAQHIKIVLSLFFLIPLLAQADPLMDPYAPLIHAVERKYAIPHGLLSAISKVESGRYHEKHRRIISWPWVIHAEGRGQFFNHEHQVIAAVQNLKNRGVTNIDVGIMQVNLIYHGQAFTTLNHAFNPQTNIEYAARYLRSLKREHTTWPQAIAHYHSALPEHYIPYCQKVYKMWQAEQKNAFRLWPKINYGHNRKDHRRDNQTNQWFRSPNFRIIRLHSKDKMSRKPFDRVHEDDV